MRAGVQGFTPVWVKAVTSMLLAVEKSEVDKFKVLASYRDEGEYRLRVLRES